MVHLAMDRLVISVFFCLKTKVNKIINNKQNKNKQVDWYKNYILDLSNSQTKKESRLFTRLIEEDWMKQCVHCPQGCN